MRIFYEEWECMHSFLIDKKAPLFHFSEEELNRQLLSAELKNQNRQLATGDLNDSFLIQQLPTAELENEWIELFLKVPFTQHRLIIRGAEVTEERVFISKKWQLSFGVLKL